MKLHSEQPKYHFEILMLHKIEQLKKFNHFIKN